MKRLIYLIALLASFTLLTGFGPLLKGQKVLYRGTVTGLRISAVDGTAFIDGANASITDLANGNNVIEVYDASGRMLRGFLKSQGAGETLGAELVTNGGFDSDVSGWAETGGTIASVSGGESGNCCELTYVYGSEQPVCQTVAVLSTGFLGYFSSSVKSGTSGNQNSSLRWSYNGSYDGISSSVEKTGTTTTSWVNRNGYATVTSTKTNAVIRLFKLSSTAGTMLFDSVSLKQVTAPSTSGAVICSTKGGAVENWASKNASFTYNAASYYCIVKAAR